MLPPNLTLPGIQREEKPRVGRTDPIHAGPNEVICFHAKSSDQPFGSLHLEQGHHLGMWRSIQLSWRTLLLWRSQKRYTETKDHQRAHPSSPEQETYSWLAGYWV